MKKTLAEYREQQSIYKAAVSDWIEEFGEWFDTFDARGGYRRYRFMKKVTPIDKVKKMIYDFTAIDVPHKDLARIIDCKVIKFNALRK